MRKLSESVWGDIRKKSIGQETRLEDNVNDLDLKGFTQYLKNKYPETATTQTKSSQIRTDGISSIYIPILPWGYNAAYELIYKFERRRLLIHDRYNSNPKLPSKLKFLEKSYMFTTFDSLGESEFFTKQGKPIETNEQVIEIIEMILDNYQGEDLMISKKISESVWGDLRKKSLGQETRIEEDVNSLSIDGFYEYLLSTYKEYSSRAFDGISNFESGDTYEIYIPFEIMKSDSDRFMKLYLTYKKKKNKYTNICFHFDVLKYNPELEHILKEKFIVEKSEALRQVDIYIKESGDIKNSDIIDLLDILLANVEYPALEKQEKP